MALHNSETMPQWYQYSLGVIVAASFGVRSATKFFGKKNGYKSKRRFHGQEENPSSGTTQEEPQQTR